MAIQDSAVRDSSRIGLAQDAAAKSAPEPAAKPARNALAIANGEAV